MKKSIHKFNKIIQKILVYSLIIATLIFVGLLYPNRAYFNYEYILGSKWRYETLKAPFNFPIKKSLEDINAEKQSIKDNFIPRYKKDNSYKEYLLNYIDNIALDSVSESGASNLKNFLKKEINKIFSNGVLNASDLYSKLDNGLIILNNNKSEKVNKSDVFTPEKAKEYLINKINLLFPKFEYIVNSIEIKPNLIYDEELNNKILEEKLSKISINEGVVKKGEVIINPNEIVTKGKYQILNSFKEAYSQQIGQRSKFYFLYLGYFILTILILAILLYYLYANLPAVFNNPWKLFFVLMWVAIFSYLVFAADKAGEFFVYLIPFAIVPIIILNFFNKQLALYLHVVIILIASLITKLGYEFTVLQLIIGMISILIFSEIRFWNSFFIGIFIILLTYIIGYISLQFINTGSIAFFEWKILAGFIINALLLLLAYPLVPLIEKPFGFVSTITISELGDLNKPLLKKLSLKAPGTLQHSLQVANLCEAAAEKINANSLLVKVGALYHDIGKTYAPEYFIENQKKSEDPYKDLDYFESAKKIIDHVIIGEKMAKKNKLPKILQRFIVTHHGTTRVEYFYRKQVNDFPDKEFDESIFRYPGPKPKTKEEAIMMLADSLEAAVKSLNKPTGQDIDNLVDNISKFKIEDGQLEESELTFEEFNQIKQVFKDILRNIHHVRIEYPELKNKKEKENQ